MLLLDPDAAHIPSWAPRELPGMIQQFRVEAEELMANHPELAKYVHVARKNLSSKSGTYLDATLHEFAYYLLSLPPFDGTMMTGDSRRPRARLHALLETNEHIPAP